MKKILFVCTGNVFRSMGAEYCLKDHLAKRAITDVSVDSAGIAPQPQPILTATIERLAHHGIAVEHEPKEITKELVADQDLIIAMSTNHQDYIYEMYNIVAPLFNNVAHGETMGVLDINEARPGILVNLIETDEVITFVNETVDHIHNAIPYIIGNYPKWL